MSTRGRGTETPTTIQADLGSVAGDAQVIVDTATAAAGPVDLAPGAAYTVVVPAGGDLRELDTQHLLETPRRKKGVAHLRTAGSLVQYVGKHGEEGPTDIFADLKQVSIVAVLNGHADLEPGWGDHKAVLIMVKTEQWARWLSRHRNIGTLEDFAEFIEDNLEDVAEPPGADLLELAQSFQATSSAQFKQARRLATGEVQFAYTETVDAKAGQQGQLTIPQEFTVVLAPFEGTEAIPITARLRYRVGGGSLRIGYILDRPDKVEREAFDQAVAHVQSETGYSVLHGTPPA